MIAILSRRVIASKYVWVCYWKLKPFNVLILDANLLMHLGPQLLHFASCAPCTGSGVRRVNRCSLVELAQAAPTDKPLTRL